MQTGVAREEGEGESAGLLRAVGLGDEAEMVSPVVDRGSIL
jgi:chloride channel 3/4/5